MTGIVVSGANTVPYDIAGFPNFNTDTGAVAPLINTEIVKKSFPSMISYLLPKGDATLFALSSRMKEETALQIEHGFNAKIMIFPSFTVSAAAANTTSGITLAVYDSSQVIPNGLYMAVGTTTGGSGTLSPSTAALNEMLLVSSVPNGTSVVVTRSSDWNVANIALDTTFVHVGNAFGDASLRPNSFLTKEIRVVNYTQIFRDAWAVSGTVAAIQNLIGESNVAKSKIECAQYHAMAMEKAMIFSSRHNAAGVSGATNAFRTMGGVISQITDGQSANLFLPGTVASGNIATCNSKISGTATAGALSMVDLENWADNLVNMSYDPMSGMDRIVFLGRTAHKVFNRLARTNANYFIENGTNEWGLRFSRLQMTRYTLILIEHPLFNTNLNWAALAVAIDLPSISLAYMLGRKTKSEEYNQNTLAIDNAIDAHGGSLLTELTILCKNPAGCGVLTNIQTAVVSGAVVA